MDCKQLNARLNDYLDGTLDEADGSALEQHLETCADCRGSLDDALRLDSLLKDYGTASIPAPDAAFFDQALLRAASNGSRLQRNRWWTAGFGSAVAAGLAIWIISAMFLDTPDVPDNGSTIPAVTMALAEPQTVNLVFASATELDNATLTVTLPPGVEIAGFDGQREISWMTSLRQGRNLLPLTLIATSPHGGELMATLSHQDDDRTFRLRVTVI